jgi:hypothetical protein
MGMSHQSLCFMVKLKKIRAKKTKMASKKLGFGAILKPVLKPPPCNNVNRPNQSGLSYPKKVTKKGLIYCKTSLAGKLDRRHIQIILLILSLTHLVIGAGAAGGGGLGGPGNGG